MTILTALQSASARLVGRRPSTFFSSTDNLEVELTELANEAATDIAKKHDWRRLIKLASNAGDGETIAFDLPDDYDRMTIDNKVWSSAWTGMAFQRAETLDDWYYYQQYLTPGAPGYWIILGGQMQVYPAAGSDENVEFYYLTKNIVQGSVPQPKESFTQDADTFLLPERLLTLSLIWRWRSQKGLDYAEDMRNFEIALSEEIARDKGSRMLAVGPSRWPGDVRPAYPGIIQP